MTDQQTDDKSVDQLVLIIKEIRTIHKNYTISEKRRQEQIKKLIVSMQITQDDNDQLDNNRITDIYNNLTYMEQKGSIGQFIKELMYRQAGIHIYH